MVHQLEDLLKSRASIFEAKVTMLEEHLDKVDCEDLVMQNDLIKFKKLAETFGKAAHRSGSEESVYCQSVNQIREGEMQALLGNINDLGQNLSTKADLYANYYALDGSPSEALDKFRFDLLKHLAGSIVVKEHKIRYQKEQFDRYMYTAQDPELKILDRPLRDFAKTYAHNMETHIDFSHGARCPKIEASYDDFGEKTIRPLNATIFYYFFSANRSGKTFAQWMLSAARYPNDKVRRAYMRFFA